MTAHEVIEECRRRGINLKLDRGKGDIIFDAPKGAMVSELLDALKSHKFSLLALLGWTISESNGKNPFWDALGLWFSPTTNGTQRRK